jgi:hypothetical protein
MVRDVMAVGNRTFPAKNFPDVIGTTPHTISLTYSIMNQVVCKRIGGLCDYIGGVRD